MDGSHVAVINTAAPLIGLVGVTGVVGWVVTTWLKIRHGYPLENGWGKPLYPVKSADADRMVAALVEENRALRTELGELRNRVGVLERIATDPAARLDREIASLAHQGMN